QHHLEAEAEIARVAVAQHLNSPGIGREVAADLAAPLGAETQWEETIDALRRLLDLREDATGLDGHGEIDGIDRADAVHAPEAQDDAASVLAGDGAAAEPGIAALRHDRDPRGMREPHDLGNLSGVGGPHHEPR